MLKTLKDLEIKGKRILVRCDFNVPINKAGEIEDDLRVEKTIPTINYLIKNEAKIILMSHLGDPGGKFDEKLSLKPIGKKLGELLKIPVKMAQDCVGKQTRKDAANLKEGEIMLLENLRFHKGEKEGSDDFAKQLADLGEVYVNDAFGACHRSHASITGLAKILPSVAGLLLEKEINILSSVLNNPWRPLVTIIGGAKIETKTKIIKNFLQKADHVLIGGKISNTILEAKGICIGRPWLEEGLVKEIEKFDLTSIKLHLPIDALMSPDATGQLYIRIEAPAKVRKDELLLDIGPETIKFFSGIIKSARMIVWAGPMGLFENPAFERGTKEIAQEISKNQKAFKIAGGGDTIHALSKFNLLNKFDHICTGGGAMLEFLGGNELPGIKALGG